MGRQITHIDEIQIKRWKNFKRLVMTINKNCEENDLTYRKKITPSYLAVGL